MTRRRRTTTHPLRRLGGLAMAACLAAGLAPGALADPPEPTIESIRFTAEGWIFAPAMVDQSVSGFLAWAGAEANVTGNNITLMWIERHPTKGWVPMAWGTADIGAAALWVNDHLGQNAFQGDPVVLELMGNANAAALAPKPLVQGLYSDDPLQAIVASTPNPADYVNSLADAGWAAAPRLSPLTVQGSVGGIDPALLPCNVANQTGLALLMDDLTVEAEMTLTGAATLAAACTWPCRCTTAIGATTCGPWVLFTVGQGMGGSTVCTYRRTCTTPWTNSGRYLICLGCGSSGTTTTTQSGTTMGPPCTPPP